MTSSPSWPEDTSFSPGNYYAMYEYYSDGTLKEKNISGEVYTYYADSYLESVSLSNPDGEGNTYSRYYDEAYYTDGDGNSYGRTQETRRPENDYDSEGCVGWYYTYHSGSSTIYRKYGYANSSNMGSPPLGPEDTGFSPSNHYIMFEYHSSGNLKSKTLTSTDQYGKIYYEYKDEDWQGQGYGRLYATISGSPDGDGIVANMYGYYSDSGYRAWEYACLSTDWSNIKYCYTYNNNADNRMLRKRVYDGYVVDNVRNYEYYDEDWQGQGYGRLMAEILETQDGDCVAYRYVYHPDGSGFEGVVQYKYGYSNYDNSNSETPTVLTNLVVTHEYDENGDWISTIWANLPQAALFLEIDEKAVAEAASAANKAELDALGIGLSTDLHGDDDVNDHNDQ